ncbi:MAG: metallopeptidase TldD-related protein [Pyrinomonadaceae bacterium]|jgi:TldD protein|nr:metallopeptidase TldD-related protein [Pyrinomonadaceae bacterium]
MKRRDFLAKGAFALGAVATSDLWIGKIVAGENNLMKTSLLDTYFQISQDQIKKILAATLAKGAEFADVFFEYRITTSLGFEEDIVKSARRGIIQGVGIRAVKGDQIGFAFSEELTIEKMLEAANAAAAIAADNTTKARILPVGQIKPKNLYPIQELATAADLTKKLSYIKEANEAAKKYDSRIVRVNVGFNDEIKHIAYANSDGVYWEDSQPIFMFTTFCIAEEKGKRENGYSGGGGRIGLEYFDKNKKPADIAKNAARLAVLNLSAVEIEAGMQTVVLGNSESAVLLHEAVGHGLEADFNYKGLSNYSKRIGEKVASEQCTVVDEGLFENMRGTINVDDEGNAPQSTVLIENGILRNYMSDRISAKQLGVKSSGNGRRQAYNYPPMPRMTNTYLRNGKYSEEEILKSVKKGIYAKGFTGGNVDITKGDFTFSCSEAYLIEDGKITTPVKGATLVGNGPDVMTKISMVGNDLKFTDGGWTCGKNGQSVPVGMGTPTVKVSEITVGGTLASQSKK